MSCKIHKLEINIYFYMSWKRKQPLCHKPVYDFSVFRSLNSIWYFLPVFTTHWSRGSVKIM